MADLDDARRRAAATKRRESREALMAAAEALYIKHGALNHRDVANHSGISSATLFSRFGSIDGLLAAVYEVHYVAIEDAVMIHTGWEALNVLATSLCDQYRLAVVALQLGKTVSTSDGGDPLIIRLEELMQYCLGGISETEDVAAQYHIYAWLNVVAEAQTFVPRAELAAKLVELLSRHY